MGNYVRAVRVSVGQIDHSKPAQPEKITPAENKRPFRAKPATLLDEEVKTMQAKHGFYSLDWNNDGKGITHSYKPETIAGGKVVRDEATGLTWQQSGSTKGMTYAAADEYVRGLNAKNFADHNDWRLPTLEESMSLMEPKEPDGWYIDLLFDRTQQKIWTADKYSAGVAWVADFGNGYCPRYPLVTRYVYVRVVR